MQAKGIFYRALSFVLVGVVSTFCYVAGVRLLVELAGTDPGLAAAVVYLSLLPVNFVLHRKATFRAAGGARGKLLRFLGMHAITAAGAVVVVRTTTGVFGLPLDAGTLLVAVLAPIFNFIMMQYWVFGRDALPSNRG